MSMCSRGISCHAKSKEHDGVLESVPLYGCRAQLELEQIPAEVKRTWPAVYSKAKARPRLEEASQTKAPIVCLEHSGRWNKLEKRLKMLGDHNRGTLLCT